MKRQHEIVDVLGEKGRASSLAESLLEQFEQTLEDHETHLSRLLAS